MSTLKTILAVSTADSFLNGFCEWLLVACVVITALWITVPSLSRMTKQVWRSVRPAKQRKKNKDPNEQSS